MPVKFLMHDKILYTLEHYCVTEISQKLPKSDFTLLANYCLLFSF